MRHACIFTACLVLSLSLAQAGSARQRISAVDIFQLRTVADPQISPDGEHVVYVINFADIRTDAHYSNLWIVDFDGSNNRPITSGNFQDQSPRWSPDGKRIAFLSNRGGTAQIWERWTDTGEIQKITDLPEEPSRLSWSPNGKQIAFLSLVSEPVHKLGNMPAPPPGAKWADRARIIDTLVYRFDQTGYLKPGNIELFVVAADGGAPRQISRCNLNLGPDSGAAATPVWTPDGKSILLSANCNADAEDEPLNTDIYEYSLSDGSVKTLTTRKGPDTSPVVSRDGHRIAYIGFDDKHLSYQVRHLYMMFNDGSKPRQLAQDLDRDVQNLCWAPDGSGVYFIYQDHGDGKLGYAPLQGKTQELASHLGANIRSYGGSYALSIALNGRFATTILEPENPGDIAVGKLGSGVLSTISHVNRDFLGQRKLATVEPFSFTSSKGALKLDGWIVKPPDFDASRKYPLILEIHGGPFASYGDCFDFEKQVMAAENYVVVYVNPRGSTSYGESFGNLINHAYPGDDFYDLNSGVDAVIAKGYIDPANVFVTGGSGGGVLTCWMIGRSRRFRAAAAFCPIIDWYSWIGTADIGAVKAHYWFAGEPWESPELLQNYERRSPLSLVKNVRTPTLIMGGEEDYRTPISQAEEYYLALKVLKIPTLLVRFPGEGHGLRRRPSHQVAKISYILTWFDQYRQK